MYLLKQLNPAQQIAAAHVDGALLVLAGAGSGKTRVVAYRIAYLISQGVAPSQILAVTFTNKAAGEMQERVNTLLQDQVLGRGKVTVCTFHSLGVRILRESIQVFGYQSNFLIYDAEDADKLLKGCLYSLHLRKESYKSYRQAISQAKNNLQAPDDVDLSTFTSTEILSTFVNVYKLYQQRLREAHALDFDDLLYMVVRLFREYPAILARYQTRWPYLLIDEYQDTNQAQYLIAKLIVGEKKNIFAVGDPDQTIYSWRGANIQNILHFEEDYPGAKIIRLEQNYRSRSNILEAANTLIKHNGSRYEKKLWSDRGTGEKISLFVAASEREEAEFVVNQIQRLHAKESIPYKEITIFYRTNFQSRVFEDALLRKRIPYVIVGGISFYQRKEIKDILAFLRMITSDHDLISFERTINLPKRGIGPTTIEKIKAVATDRSTPILLCCKEILRDEEELLKLTARQREGLQEYISLIDHLRTLRPSSSLAELLLEVIRAGHYLEVLKEDKDTYQDRKENVDELIAKAHEWSALYATDALDTFLEELSLKSAIDEASFGYDKVNMMTLHNSKGLEFDSVFLVGMEEELLPHTNAKNSYEELEEERRLCYVGITRARERLWFTAATSRFIWGSTRFMRLSRFLQEMPKEHIVRCKNNG